MFVAAVITALVGAGVVAFPLTASAVVPVANVKITEIAYGGLAVGAAGGDGEYVELTNLGATAVDLTGWTYFTTAKNAVATSLSGLGTLAPGESGIVTDLSPAEFRTEWALTSSVKVVNDATDTINSGPATITVTDANSNTVESLSYVKGFISDKGASEWLDATHLTAQPGATGWHASAAADSEGSWTSASKSVGSPGISSASSQATAAANVKFTEFAYGGKAPESANGPDGEYAEVTNVGRTPVDMTGWTFTTDDSKAVPVSLTGFGTLAPGESGIVTDLTAAEFRTEWSLTSSVKIATNTTANLNSGPRTFFLDDASQAVADSVAYAKGFFSGKGVSVWVDAAHLGAKSGTTGWTVSTANDQEGSWTSANTAVGSPGASSFGIHAASFVHTTSTGGGTTPPPVTDPNYKDISINEVTSENNVTLPAPLPVLSDVIELYNSGTHDVSLAGWKQIDSGAASAATDFSGSLYVNGVKATTIPSHGFGVFQSTKGLSSGGDGVKIYTPDGILVDELDFTDGQAGVGDAVNTDGAYHAIAACPDGSNTLLEVKTASFGSSNATACATGITPFPAPVPEAPCDTQDSGTDPGIVPTTAVTWPGSQTPTTIDPQCNWVTTESGQDLSGLAFDPTNANILYAVKNKSHVYKLVKTGGTWAKDTANGWSAGKDIRFPGGTNGAGTGLPDSEGLTVGADGALYITTERDNNNSNVALDTILRFDPASTATTLVATDEWNLTSAIGFTPTTDADANLGFEGVAYVPDSFLVAHGFRTDAGTLYNPATYPGKAQPGLFFGAVEKTGHLIAYVLNTDHTFSVLADINSGMAGVMDAQFDPDLGEIWAHCDNTCGNATALLKLGTDGHFTVDRYYARPANLPNYNLEGFAVAPVSSAVNGQREVLWTDDGNRFGHSLWSGTIDVSLPSPVITLSDATPAPGQTITITVTGLSPNTSYTATLHSTPVVLGSGVSNAAGVLTLTVTIPSTVVPGAHTITISPTADPSTVVASLALTVGGTLAETGSDPRGGLFGGVLLLLLGAGTLLIRRRRRALAG